MEAEMIMSTQCKANVKEKAMSVLKPNPLPQLTMLTIVREQNLISEKNK